ncbi:MAG: DEAD/DEAH box helicase [Candidatus Shapirobacteria bacterium]|nr:DEAD/DEAH box helicase [Candidatus Shapirobacteria bacterium]
MELRPYQKTAVEKLQWSAKMPGNDLVSLPTGAGKSLIIAQIASDNGTHVLIIQPTREILEQNLDKLSVIVGKDVVGVYSASLGRKEIKKYTFATIGSIFRKPEDFVHFELIIIDECHLVNPKRLGSMFLEFLNKVNELKGSAVKVVGLTATPYRLCQQYLRYPNGFIDTITTIKLINRVRPAFWNRLIYNINVGELIEQGYLCPLKYHNIVLVKQEQMKLNISHSDFDLEAFEDQIAEKDNEIYRVLEACSKNFKSTLVFCPTVENAEKLADMFFDGEVVSAKTKPKERKRIINGFKSGEIKIVFNVGVLTTGFDHPALDCIVLLRPTRSIGLLYQMVGRGLRIAEGKKFCTVVDLTDTIKKIGRVETFKLEKVENKWNLTSETNLTGWNGVELYKFTIQK